MKLGFIGCSNLTTLNIGNYVTNIAPFAFELCEEAGFTPKCSIYLDQLMTSYNMSLLGMGIALVSDTLIKAVSPTNDLLFYKKSIYLL